MSLSKLRWGKQGRGLPLALAGWGMLATSLLVAQDSPAPGATVSDLFGIPAGPYSAGVANPASPAPDDPIPGFVGGQVNPKILGWAAQVNNYSPANPAAIDSFWKNTGNLLQPVTGNVFDVVSLGDLSAADIAKGVAPGSLTVAFDQPVGDGAGPDLVIFGNAFQLARSTKVFAKLAYVEVSTDGVVFARFPSVDTNPRPAGTSWTYLVSDATKIYNLFGKAVNAYGSSWGNPFDLHDLSNNPLVLAGAVDLQNIRYVRVVAVPGSGAYQDSLGDPIYSPWPTFGSPGPEIQAVGILNLGHPVADDTQAAGTSSAAGVGAAVNGARSVVKVSAKAAPKPTTAGGGSYDSILGDNYASDTGANPVANGPDPVALVPAQTEDNSTTLPASGNFAPVVLGFNLKTRIPTGEAGPSAPLPPPGQPGVFRVSPPSGYPDRSFTPTGLPVPAGTFRPGVWDRAVQRVAYLTGWEPTPASLFVILVAMAAAIGLTIRHRRTGKTTSDSEK